MFWGLHICFISFQFHLNVKEISICEEDDVELITIELCNAIMQSVYKPQTNSAYYHHCNKGTRLLSYLTEVEETIEYVLEEITQYYRSISLRASPDKTQVTTFHLQNK